MKAVVAAFNQEKALVGAFSVITNLRMQLFEALTGTPRRPAPPADTQAVSHPSQTSGEGTEGGRRWHQHWAGRWFTGVGQGGHWPVWPGESLLPSGDKSWSVSRVQHRDTTLTECYHIPQVTHDSPPLGGHWEHWEHTLTA